MENFNIINRKDNKVTIEFKLGRDIQECIEEAVSFSKSLDLIVVSKFNGEKIFITPDSDVNEIVSEYRGDFFKETALSKELETQRTLEIEALNNKTKAMINRFENLDFSNYNSVLFWLINFQDCSNSIDINSFKKRIITKLNEQGYSYNFIFNKELDENNKEKNARYLISQCIECLEKLGAIHPTIHRFYSEYLKKFND